MPSPSVAPPSAATSPQSVRPKAPARPATEQAPEAAASGSFAALLGGLAGAAPLQEPVPEQEVLAERSAEPAWNAVALPQGMAAPGTLTGAWQSGAPASAFSGLLPPQLRRAGALVAETARMDSASEPSPEPAAGAGKAAAARPGAAGAALSAAAALSGQIQPRTKTARLPAATAMPGTAAAHGAALASAPPATAAARTTVPERLESTAGLAAALRSALGGASSAAAPAAQAGGDSAAGGRAPNQGASPIAEAGLPQTAVQAEGTTAAPASDGVPVPEGQTAPDAVAEQVAYWATDTLQSAELTLAHEGRPVEVSVSLDGQQAHVAFRSDQSDTRALLGADTGQLRDLLGQEGLVLAGVSVGSGSGSAQSDAPPRPPQGRAAARQAAVAAGPGPAAPGEQPRHAGMLNGRKVDLFV